jgi:hypothetical protein
MIGPGEPSENLDRCRLSADEQDVQRHQTGPVYVSPARHGLTD